MVTRLAGKLNKTTFLEISNYWINWARNFFSLLIIKRWFFNNFLKYSVLNFRKKFERLEYKNKAPEDEKLIEFDTPAPSPSLGFLPQISILGALALLFRLRTTNLNIIKHLQIFPDGRNTISLGLPRSRLRLACFQRFFRTGRPSTASLVLFQTLGARCQCSHCICAGQRHLLASFKVSFVGW